MMVSIILIIRLIIIGRNNNEFTRYDVCCFIYCNYWCDGFFSTDSYSRNTCANHCSNARCDVSWGLLGAKRGGLSLLIFIALVAVGVPLLAGGRGGLGALLGPGGGYILAWPIAAFVIGYLVEKNINSLNFFKIFIYNVFGAMLIVYLCG